MATEVLIPKWSEVEDWGDNGRPGDNPVYRFILDNEPAGEDGINFRHQLIELMQQVDKI